MSIEVTEYLNKRVIQLLDQAEQFDKILLDNAEKIRTILTSVSSRKRNEKEVTHNTVKNDLTEVQEKHYTNFLLEQDMKNTLSAIKEIDIMAEELKIDLGITEDQQQLLFMIKENHKSFYKITNGGLDAEDTEIFKKIQEQLKEKLSNEDGLKAVFDNIV